MITQKELKRELKYDPKTGIFTRRKTKGKIKKGSVAGWLCKGYIRIRVNNEEHTANRLAFLYMDGYLPERETDHINRNTIDNRYSNLREVSTACNQRNRGNPCNNTSGVKGVCWSKKSNKWGASVMVSKKTKYLGLYDDFDDAVCARLAAEQALNWSGCDSSSPAFKYVRANIQNLPV